MSPVNLKIQSGIHSQTRKILITEDHIHTKFLENKNIRTTSLVSGNKENENWIISHIITEVQNGNRHEYGLAREQSIYPLIGARHTCLLKTEP